jgi:hypothetical protein
MVFSGTIAANRLDLSPSDNSTIQLYLTDHTPNSTDTELVFTNLTLSNLCNTGTGTVNVHLANAASLSVNSSGSGITLLENQTVNELTIMNSCNVKVIGGTYASIYNTKGNLYLTGNVTVTNELRGARFEGNFSTLTIGDGETETTVTAKK